MNSNRTRQRARLPLIAAAAIVLLSVAGSAQQDERWKTLEAQIDRIYAKNEYSLPRFGPARWLEDGTAYTTVERASGDAGGSDIVRYDAATGARSILISNTQLIPEGSKRALSIADYVWSADGSKLLIFTNTQKVWRQNTRGDYWVLCLPTAASQCSTSLRCRVPLISIRKTLGDSCCS